jgi:hypothetical protein
MFGHTGKVSGITALAAVLLVVFLSVLFFMLFNMSHDVGMSSNAGDCPFMSTGSVVCSMNIDAHISSWKTLSLATPLVLLLILLVPRVRSLYVFCARRFRQMCYLWEIPSLEFPHMRVVYAPIPNHLQTAFSNGILHPKLF